MDDYIKLVIGQIPLFFMELMEVAFAPKTFIRTRFGSSSLWDINKASLFLAISVFLSGIPIVFYIEATDDSYVMLGMVLFIEAIITVLTIGVLRLSWKLVGGTANLRDLFICTSYLWGPAFFIGGLGGFVANAAHKAISPETFGKPVVVTSLEEWLSHVNEAPGELFAFFITILTLLVMLVWFVFSWGAYREINGVRSRFKSFIAFSLQGFLSIPLILIMFILLAPVMEAVKFKS